MNDIYQRFCELYPIAKDSPDGPVFNVWFGNSSYPTGIIKEDKFDIVDLRADRIIDIPSEFGGIKIEINMTTKKDHEEYLANYNKAKEESEERRAIRSSILWVGA